MVWEGSLRTGHLCLEKRMSMVEEGQNRWYQQVGRGQLFKAPGGIWNIFWG